MSKPQEHKDSSCFIASKAQIEAAKKRAQMMKSTLTSQALDPAALAAQAANQKLKAIIVKENRMKDPHRVKKAVTFMLNFSEESEEETKDGAEEGAAAQSSPKKKARKGDANKNKKEKVIYVNATDDLTLPERKH